MTKETADLKSTLEEIRQRDYDDVPAGLVEQIVEIEYESLEDRARAPKEITRLIADYLEGGE